MKRGSSGAAKSLGGPPLVPGDPRAPEAAQRYDPKKLLDGEDEIPPVDVASLLGIVAGLVGVLLKHKLGCWLALMLGVQGLANMRNADNDLKQIMCCFSFAVMGIVTMYFGPTHPAASAPP